MSGKDINAEKSLTGSKGDKLAEFIKDVNMETVREHGKHGTDTAVVTVLLTRYDNAFSNIVHMATGRGYTHASIALDEKMEYFYSIGGKGFKAEYPRKHRMLRGKSIAYKFEIPKYSYDRIKAEIDSLLSRAQDIKFNGLGAYLTIAGIRIKRKDYMFCSQIVVDMLKLVDGMNFNEPSHHYLPNQLPKILGEQPYLKEVIYNPLGTDDNLRGINQFRSVARPIRFVRFKFARYKRRTKEGVVNGTDYVSDKIEGAVNTSADFVVNNLTKAKKIGRMLKRAIKNAIK